MTKIVKANTVGQFHATIHMAGDYKHAKQICRLFVMEGACVQLQECDYIYTGGAESGFTARIMHYARFPKEKDEIYSQAERLAYRLCRELGQTSFSIETPQESIYFETEFKK